VPSGGLPAHFADEGRLKAGRGSHSCRAGHSRPTHWRRLEGVHLSLAFAGARNVRARHSQPFYARRPRFHCTVCSAYAAITRGTVEEEVQLAPPRRLPGVAPGQRLVVRVSAWGFGQRLLSPRSGNMLLGVVTDPRACRPGRPSACERFWILSSRTLMPASHSCSTMSLRQARLRFNSPGFKTK